MQDILGKALLDYLGGNYTEDIITETNISEEDELPLPYFFRSFSEMPPIEQKALQMAKGRILDVGCGAGSHALYLQKKNIDVLGIDISPGAVEVAKQRGLKNVQQMSLLDISSESFDPFNTILLLMNGTGIFEKLEHVAHYLQHLKSLLAPNGQILIDSSDLKYMYDATEDGGIWIPADAYYGELQFTMCYKEMESEPFHWLYMDERIFESAALSSGFTFKVVERGEHYDYLARLTLDL